MFLIIEKSNKKVLKQVILIIHSLFFRKYFSVLKNPKDEI